jgi:hypothetical protein
MNRGKNSLNIAQKTVINRKNNKLDHTKNINYLWKDTIHRREKQYRMELHL